MKKTITFPILLGLFANLGYSQITFVDFTAGDTSLEWIAENDPVMGGVSYSNVTVEADRLAWDGEVKIVPSLAAPGFCYIQSKGRTLFADASNFTHLTLRVRSTIAYAGFKVGANSYLAVHSA